MANLTPFPGPFGLFSGYGNRVSTTPRIALVTTAGYQELNDESQPIADALKSRGAEPTIVQWDDPTVDWDEFDLAVIIAAWDASDRIEEFLTWAKSVPRLVNPPNVLRWNIDKHYLQPLAEHGLPVIETLWLEPNRLWEKRDLHNRFPAREEFVIKPAISAGTVDTGRYTAVDADSRRFAIEHAKRLLDDNRSVMVQRYIPEIDSHGEVSLIFLHGTYSHAVRKEPMLTPDSEDIAATYQQETLRPYVATPQEIEAGQEVLAFARARVPGRNTRSRPLLYARVDVVTQSDGTSLLMELELIDANLHTTLAPGATERFADAILAEAAMERDTQNINLA